MSDNSQVFQYIFPLSEIILLSLMSIFDEEIVDIYKTEDIVSKS